MLVDNGDLIQGSPSVDNNWSFPPIRSKTKLDIHFETSPSDKAAQFIQQKGQYLMTNLNSDEVGFAVYRIELQK